jgi:hypothetical protein
MNQITIRQLFNFKSKKLSGTDLVHFLEDGTKLKVPSEITTPLSKLKPEFKQVNTLTQYLTFFPHIYFGIT